MFHNSAYWYGQQSGPHYFEDDPIRKRPRLAPETNIASTGTGMNITSSPALPTTSHDLRRYPSYWEPSEPYSNSSFTSSAFNGPRYAANLSQTSSSSYVTGHDSAAETFALEFENFDLDQTLHWENPSVEDTVLSQHVNSQHEAAENDGHDASLEDFSCCYGMVKITSTCQACFTS